MNNLNFMNEQELNKNLTPENSEGENEQLSQNEDQNSFNQEEIRDMLRLQQNFPFAAIGGTLAAFISAILWAAITVATEFQIGYMAIAVGLITGFSVRFFGAGVDAKFGILSAFLSLLGCLLGNLFSQIGFIAQEYSYSYIETISYLDFSTIVNIMKESFSPVDLLFYGIAIYEGYRFAFRTITAENAQNGAHSAALKWRTPLAIFAAVGLIVIFFVLRQGYSGYKIYNYESGEKMSEGNIINGKYDGAWTFYHKNGEILSKGDFAKDLRAGSWQWYTENGALEQTGSYENGVETGVWTSYYENGHPYDSTLYESGMRNGKYVSRYENGVVYQSGSYEQDQPCGIWETYYENGQLQSKGEMKNGKNTGEWHYWFENGNKQEESFFENADEEPFVKNSWNLDGSQIKKDGEFIDSVTFSVSEP